MGSKYFTAFLIKMWVKLEEKILETDSSWAKAIDAISESPLERFTGRYSLLSTDQGVRAYMQVATDLFYVSALDLDLPAWRSDQTSEEPTLDAVDVALESFGKELTRAVPFLGSICATLSEFDWRTSSTPGLTPEEVQMQAAYRGSGGYKLLRNRLLLLLAEQGPSPVSESAATARRWLGY